MHSPDDGFRALVLPHERRALERGVSVRPVSQLLHRLRGAHALGWIGEEAEA